MNHIKKAKQKIGAWIGRNLFLLSIIIPILIMVIWVYCPSFGEWFKCNFGLSFYQVFLIVGAIFTLLWTDKRYKVSQEQYKVAQKQYKHAEESTFLNKANSIYFEIIKQLSDKESRKQATAKILINRLQASISSHYKTEEEQNKMRKEFFDFSSMVLIDANLFFANLTDANLSNASLLRANLTGAKFIGVDLIHVDLLNAKSIEDANFKGAKNITKWIKDKLDEDGIYRKPQD